MAKSLHHVKQVICFALVITVLCRCIIVTASKQILQKSNRELRTPSLLLVLQNNEIDVGALSFGLVDWNESAQLCKVIINIGLKTIIQIASYCYVVVVITRSLSTVALRQNFDLISPIFCLFLLDHKPPRLSCFKSQLPIRPDNV